MLRPLDGTKHFTEATSCLSLPRSLHFLNICQGLGMGADPQILPSLPRARHPQVPSESFSGSLDRPHLLWEWGLPLQAPPRPVLLCPKPHTSQSTHSISPHTGLLQKSIMGCLTRVLLTGTWLQTYPFLSSNANMLLLAPGLWLLSTICDMPSLHLFGGRGARVSFVVRQAWGQSQ